MDENSFPLYIYINIALASFDLNIYSALNKILHSQTCMYLCFCVFVSILACGKTLVTVFQFTLLTCVQEKEHITYRSLNTHIFNVLMCIMLCIFSC